ncbi:MAG: hypothetical protein GY751_17245 [Bacteroidetes bacterium]|nr:hypothetical protein [Bacteroidota bacterium]
MKFKVLSELRSAIFLVAIMIPSFIWAGDPSALNDIIHLASLEEGRSLLSTEDDYTAKWSVFDIRSRTQDVDGTRQQLLEMMKDQVLPWTEQETKRIREVVAEIDEVVQREGYNLPLPEQVSLIKSTVLEEGGAHGYTRENYIVLRQDLFGRENDMLKEILLHELFHIMTRHDAEFRESVYRIIGFTVSNTIAYPDNIKNVRITNPDAHASDSYIRLTSKDSIPFDGVMVIYANKPWDGGSFFTYLQLGFVAIDGNDGEKEVIYEDGKPMIYSFNEVTGFLEQVGMNTQYIIDPEEISADNFSYIFREGIEKPSPQIIEGIRNILLD